MATTHAMAIHTKILRVDGEVALIGSTNITRLERDVEIGVILRGTR